MGGARNAARGTGGVMTVDYGKPPKGGFAKLVPELVVADIDESLKFWREALKSCLPACRPVGNSAARYALW